MSHLHIIYLLRILILQQDAKEVINIGCNDEY